MIESIPGRGESQSERVTAKPETKIALYGGTKLEDTSVELVRCLARAFLADPHVVLVSGGIYDPDGIATSVDLAAAEEASRFVEARGQSLAARFQTWLSETPREGIARRVTGTKRVLHGSPRARRFQLVTGVDALVTVEGEGKTATVLELAMALERPALPIGFTKKDSGEFWKSDREFFESTLDLEAPLSQSLDHLPASEQDMSTLAQDIARAVLKKAGRRCLVLMDFKDREHRSFYENVVTPVANEEGFAVYKLDEQASAGDILDLFLARLRDCHAVIIDLTGFNPNVLYELGRVHEHGAVEPLILVRGTREETRLPYYVTRPLVQFVGPDAASAPEVIRQHLGEGRRSPRRGPAPTQVSPGRAR